MQPTKERGRNLARRLVKADLPKLHEKRYVTIKPKIGPKVINNNTQAVIGDTVQNAAKLQCKEASVDHFFVNGKQDTILFLSLSFERRRVSRIKARRHCLNATAIPAQGATHNG